MGEYTSGYMAAGQPYERSASGPKWYQMHSFYENDDALLEELFTRFMGPAVLTEYQKTKRETRATVAANRAARERAWKEEQAQAEKAATALLGRPPAATTAAPVTPVTPAPTVPPVDVPPAPPRPSGPRNSVLTLQAESRTTFYLLDDDFEHILKRAGFRKEKVLGVEQPLLNSFEIVTRWKATTDNPLTKLLTGGESILPEDLEEQYARGLKALREHTVARITTDSTGKATVPDLPAGTYYVYGTTSQFVKTGARGTIIGNTVTLHDTGIDAATVWNLKVVVKPGRNTVTLTPDNAAFVWKGL
jgi:hypothetical protein